MKYKMVASDFDDTLLSSSKHVSDFTKQIIHKYVKAGGRFVLSTGRMFASIRQEAKKLGLSGVAIAYQGALIKDIETAKTLKSVDIPYDLAIEYITFLKTFTPIIQMYMDDNLYIENPNPYSNQYSKFCNITANPVGNLVDFVKQSDRPINKIYCFIEQYKCDKFREEAIKNFGDKLLINSSKPWNIEAVNIKTSKGVALKYLCDLYDIDRKELMAFGDSLNDLEMIKFAGLGVAVENAMPTVKKYSDYITASCDDDGVARAIEKFCLR